MEVDEGPSVPSSPPSKAQQPQYALDSDDETLRFDNDDDLYSSDLDEVDAQWVRKQVPHTALARGPFLRTTTP